MKDRIDKLNALLNTLPDIDDFRYYDDEDKEFVLTNEWLCGTFSGRGFSGQSYDECTGKLIEYFDNHVNHKSMVGHIVTESGWPDLKKVVPYLINEVYSGDE